MRCKIRSILFTFLLVFLLCFSAFVSASVSVPALQSNQYIYDEANILSSDSIDEANSIIAELKVKTGAQFFVITAPSLNDLSIEDYSNELLNNHHFFH